MYDGHRDASRERDLRCQSLIPETETRDPQTGTEREERFQGLKSHFAMSSVLSDVHIARTAMRYMWSEMLEAKANTSVQHPCGEAQSF